MATRFGALATSSSIEAIIAAAGVVGGGGATQALMETRTAAAAATIDAAVKFLWTAGYAALGDKGDALYKRLQSAPTLLTSKAYFRSLDIFRADGNTNATHGGYWELVPHGGRDVFIEQFGGKADWTGTPGTSTDNLGPTQDALSFIARHITSNQRFPYRLCFGFGGYWFSGMLDIHVHAHIVGMNLEEDYATEFHFPSTLTCILVSQDNTSGESGTGTGLGAGNSTTLEGFLIRHYYATGAFNHFVYSPAHGIHARAVVIIKNLNVARIAGHGVLIHGNGGGGGAIEGAPNGWHIRDSGCHSCGGHALCVYGADSNAGSCIGWTTHTEVGGCGIYDASYFNNIYAAVHIAGYGNRGVVQGGNRYVLIAGSPIDNPSTLPNTTTPGTNNKVWYYVGPDDGSRPDVWEPWSPGGNYSLYRLPIYDSGGQRVYTGIYVEVSNAPAHILPSSVVIGGTLGCTQYSSQIYADMGIGLASKQGIGADQHFTPGSGAEYTRNGERTWVAMGLPHADFGMGPGGGLGLLEFRRLSDGDSSWRWGYSGDNLDFRSSSGAQIFSITTRYTTRSFGRSLGAPYKFSLYDPILEDTTSANNGRVIGNREVQPSDAGGYARGDRWFNVNASPGGFEGWVVTTTGAIHNVVWSNGVGYDGNTWLRNSANRIYRYVSGGSGFSTSEPTHTSGTVTAADGAIWAWAADGPPVFKQFGSIAA